jgi:heptosyltransferase II
MAGTLVVQTAFLGDVVLTTPLLRELRRARPGAPITVVTTPVGAETLARHPAVDAIEVLDKKGSDRGPLGLARAVRRIRAGRPDLAVAAQRSARSGFLVLLSGAKLRIGFAGAPGRFGYTDRVPWTPTDHAVRRYLALALPAGGDPIAADPRPEIRVAPEARERALALLAEAGVGKGAPFLAVAPGSIWGTKRWLPEGFAAVVRAALSRGLAPVLVGSPEERALCDEVALAAGVGVANLAGTCRIQELAAVLAGARALVSNDSGAGHVASAVGTPVVSIFGPTVPAFGYTPFGEANRIVEHTDLPCRPCDRHGPRVCPLGHFRCMREIGAERVLEALDQVLGARG